LSFRGDDFIQVQHCPSDQTTAPSETQINQHEEGPIADYPPNKAGFWPQDKHTKSSAQTALISPS
jgi:hypothetical protein